MSKRFWLAIVVPMVLLCVGAGIVITRLRELADVRLANPPANNDVLTYIAADKRWTNAQPPGASGGEANTGGNLGSGWTIFNDKSAQTLRFNSITNTSDLTSSSNANTFTFGLSTTGVGAGSYDLVTVDTKGRVTAGSNPTTFAGHNISDTSANLAAALTDETGSGPAVFAASPTLTGTPIISGSLQITNAINAQSLVVTNGITNKAVAASSLLRTDATQKEAAVTIGGGLAFDGTTLSATGSGSGDVTAAGNNLMTGSNRFSGPFFASSKVVVVPAHNVTTLNWDTMRVADFSTNASFTVTFSGTQSDGQSMTFWLTNANSAAITVTHPNSYSLESRAVVATTTVQGSSVSRFDWTLLGTTNHLTVATAVNTNLAAIAALSANNGTAIGWSNGLIANITAGGSSGGGNGPFTNPVIYGPFNYPIGADSTAIDWATNAYALQGISTNASFTNTFQNAPPASGNQIVYSIFNSSTLSNIQAIFMVNTAIATNNFSAMDSLTNLASITVLPGELMECKWGYNGGRYTVRYEGKRASLPTASGTVNTLAKWTGTNALGNSSVTDDGTTITANTNLVVKDTMTITNSGISSVPLTVNAFTGETNNVALFNVGGSEVFRIGSGGSFRTVVNDKWTSHNGATDYPNDYIAIAGHLAQLTLSADDIQLLNTSSAAGHIVIESVGVYQLGLDAASVVTPQAIKAADGSGTDKAGADLQLEGGQSTGTGKAGAVILRTGETLTTGSSANPYMTRFYLSPKPVDLTNATAVLVFNVSLASGKTCGLHVFATTRVDDGTEFQAVAEEFVVSAINKAGTVSTGTIPTPLGSTIASSGTISTTWTAVANGNGVDIKCNQTSTVITPTTRRVRWRVEVDSNDSTLVVTPQ